MHRLQFWSPEICDHAFSYRKRANFQSSKGILSIGVRISEHLGYDIVTAQRVDDMQAYWSGKMVYFVSPLVRKTGKCSFFPYLVDFFSFSQGSQTNWPIREEMGIGKSVQEIELSANTSLGPQPPYHLSTLAVRKSNKSRFSPMTTKTKKNHF